MDLSEVHIRQFIQCTGATWIQAMKYLEKHNHDVGAAAADYMKANSIKQTDGKKQGNEYYVGGSRSGCSVMAPPDEEDIPVAPKASKPAPPPSFTGTARTISSSVAPAPRAPTGPFAPKRTDYTVAGEGKTRLRIELPNGQALGLSVSIKATVADLKSYIVENYPEAADQPMTLAVTVPPKMLDDDSATIEETGISRAIIRCTC